MNASLFQSPATGKPPLRIGLLLGSAILPRWSAEVLDQILHSGFAGIELVIFTGAGSRIPEARRSLLFRWYERWDRRNVDPKTDPLAPVDALARIARKPLMRADADGAIERIRAKNLDVLIHLNGKRPQGALLSAAKHGVWSYCHSEDPHVGGEPAYFREVLEGNPVSGASLQVLHGNDEASTILCQGLFATSTGISHARNRVQPYWGAATFMIQKLCELHARGWDHVARNAVRPAARPANGAGDSGPSNARMVAWLAPLLLRTGARRLVARPVVRHWKLAIRNGDRHLTDGSPPPDMNGFRWVDSPRGHFFADPFVVEAEGRTWVYFEDLEYATGLGKIACAEVRDGRLGDPITVLERPYHLSYPCVFQDAGTWYMVPESAGAGSVQLYRCTRFPDTWQFERDLLKGFAVDATVWIDNGTYWYFVSHMDRRGAASQLWLYFSDSLEGVWTAHPSNPISTDVRYARCAGAIFRHKGRLFRPSQDGRGEYGRSMIFNEIVEMNREYYREEPRFSVEPTWAPDLTGTHTYGRAGAVEVIDAMVRVPRGQIQ